MHPAVRIVIAVVCGALIAFALVAGIETIGQRLLPAAAGVDLSQAASMKNLPLGALLFVLGAWIIATFVGAAVGSFIARRRVLLVAAVIGILVLAATVANFVLIPHPVWMIVAGVAGIVLAALAAGKVMSRARRA